MSKDSASLLTRIDRSKKNHDAAGYACDIELIVTDLASLVLSCVVLWRSNTISGHNELMNSKRADRNYY